MKEIVVISGKGGTGKTSLAASMAVLAGRAVVADCDVDAADLHLVLDPQIREKEDFSGGKGARILSGKCSGCGKCYELCRFDAVFKNEGHPPYLIDPVACEGCGVCSHFCPEKAVEFVPVVNGQLFVSETRYGPMVHARLGIAEENSGKLVSLVRGRAKTIAEKENFPYIITDGPPGIGCPVIASITGADAVLIVTEPTVSGEHDMERVADLAAYFKIPAFLCINKFDLNPGISRDIETKARDRGICVVGKVRYDRAVTDAQLERIPVVLFEGGVAVAGDITEAWNSLIKHLSQ